MSAGRWRVYRLSPAWPQRWAAIKVWSVSGRQFDTWREAYTYADKQARQ